MSLYYATIIQIIILLTMESHPTDTNSKIKLPPLPISFGFSLFNKEREELKRLQIERSDANSTPNQTTPLKPPDAIISRKAKEAKKDKETNKVVNSEKKTEGRWTDEEHNRFLEGKWNYKS